MDFVAINKLSLLDYPNKMSCILFTRTCNFRCPFCHNGLTLLEDYETVVPFDEVISFLKKRQGILDGVVISGGEPTLMPDLADKLRIIKDLGYLIKLDTNGSNPDILLDLIEEGLIDYVAMDIKNSLEKYDLTGGAKINKDHILRSIEILKNSGIEYEFRTTLIKEFHSKEDMYAMGKMLEGCPNLYLQKFVISDGVINKNLHPVDEDLANSFVEILEQYIDNVELRGY
ncbi:MAG: anaerobic ribonucleoside-triphosphate reductase activating protein [Bacilli bacterium]|nr:anaerobic ribonucleoside-triphosphate reductase activating protein [Bacilli bacterium]